MLVCLLALAAQAAVRAAGPAAEPSEEEIATLVAALGDDDFAAREAAAARLGELGSIAADALLTAAEVNPDLEVALRARWLVEAMPLAAPHDAAEAAVELQRIAKGDYSTRVRGMHRLLRLDSDAGIEPLARLVRLERTAMGSRVAAALLSREWEPGDPYWQANRERILAGLRSSRRPAAAFLRAVVDFSAATGPDRDAPLDAARAALATFDRSGADPAVAVPPDEGQISDPSVDTTTLRIFRRILVEMLVAAGRKPEALAEAGRLLAACWESPQDEDLTAAELEWIVSHGLPEAVDLLATRWPDWAIDNPLVAYAAALAFRAREMPERATTLADAAFAVPAGRPTEFTDRLRLAMQLARWGAADWATREYATIVDEPASPPEEFALAGILFSEFLHDQDRDDEAATVLERVVVGRPGVANGDQVLQRLQRDPRAVRSRMLFFRSCAAAARQDAAAARRAIDESLRAYGKDVDALIALYKLPDNTAAQRADAVTKIGKALALIDEEIQAVPDEANGYNEYAWLVANTVGDVRKAIQYSRISLEKSFDSSSYLDTLAHCHAAAGDLPAAVRTQSLAARQEPHNRTIRRNLERFRAEAAAR